MTKTTSIFIICISFINVVFSQSDTIYFQEYDLKGLGKFENNTPIGHWTYWHLNGNKQSEGDYKNGKYHGSWSNWHENGNLASKIEYNEGIITDIIESYHPDGQKFICLDYLRLGLNHFDNHKFKNALIYFDHAIELCPDTALTWGYRSFVKKILGDDKGSINDLTELIKLKPNDPSNYMSRGESYLLDENYPAAINDLDYSLMKDSLNGKAYLLRAMAYQAQKNSIKAIEDFSKAIYYTDKSDIRLDALKYRGENYLKINKILEAINDFDTYIKEKPNDASIIYERALAKMKLKKDKEACRDWKKAKKIDPKYSKDKIFINECK